jgi:hypothetical protein
MTIAHDAVIEGQCGKQWAARVGYYVSACTVVRARALSSVCRPDFSLPSGFGFR